MEGRKFDNGKRRWSLIPMDIIGEVTDLYTFGAKKYGDYNWQAVAGGRDRYYDALLRHLSAWRSGEHRDEETGIRTIIHVVWNAIALAWLEKHARIASCVINEKQEDSEYYPIG